MTNAILTGTNKVTEAEVFNVSAVPFTRTHHPIHHRNFIKAARESITAAGMDITKSEYVLSAGGKRMFAVWDLNHGNSELCWSIGLRNSMDKSMSLGICAGNRVFVCENLCFSGEFIAFRKHTNRFDSDELAYLTFKAMRVVVPKLKAFERWHQSLKQYPLSESDQRILLVQIMTDNVIPPSKFNQFNSLYANVYDDSLWGFHEATTEVLRGNNLLTLPKKNKVLNQILNDYIDSLDSAGSSSLGQFYENRVLIHR